VEKMDIKEFFKPIELNFRESEKVKISPVGQVVGLDGRQFIIDGALVIANTQATGLDIPLDVNHSFGEAAGWFLGDSLEPREDGIYATLELNDYGKELIDSKKFRYLSPVFIMGSNRVVLAIDSVGLVNRPNILNNALNERQEDTAMQTIEQLQVQLAEKEAEINALKEQVKEVELLREKVAKLTEKLKLNRIEMAIERNEILPSQKEFALSLDEASLEKFIEANKSSFEHLRKKTEFKQDEKVLDENLAKFATSIGLTVEQISKYL